MPMQKEPISFPLEFLFQILIDHIKMVHPVQCTMYMQRIFVSTSQDNTKTQSGKKMKQSTSANSSPYPSSIWIGAPTRVMARKWCRVFPANHSPVDVCGVFARCHTLDGINIFMFFTLHDTRIIFCQQQNTPTETNIRKQWFPKTVNKKYFWNQIKFNEVYEWHYPSMHTTFNIHRIPEYYKLGLCSCEVWFSFNCMQLWPSKYR